MVKVTVETKSRSKHVFELPHATKAQVENLLEHGFTSTKYMSFNDTYFNPLNITSVKIEEIK